MTLGHNIRIARKKKGLSQEDFAKIMDISQGYLSHLENNSREPSIDILIRLKKKLGTTYEQLLESK
jgi:transcriptional regulator with XRE-family HTH domain